MGKTPHPSNGSIFSLFARQGQKPVQYSHRSHTNPEVRARLVKWITENNRPTNIVNDWELRDLLTAGRPHINIPSHHTVSRDIKACFDKCHERIAKILREHPGRLHFATDAWTSPNHRAFVAWTVHLEFQGQMLIFLLDIVELPVSHTGVTMAKAFQEMLTHFGLQQKVCTAILPSLIVLTFHQILAMNADNASANDVQTTHLSKLDNSFCTENRVRCFNHTVQLSAIALIKPFNAGMASADKDVTAGDLLSDVDDDPVVDNGDEDEEGENDDGVGEDDLDDGVNELDNLDEEDREELLADTAIVRETVTKVFFCAIAISMSFVSYFLPASQALLFHYSIHYYPTSCMAPNLPSK